MLLLDEIVKMDGTWRGMALYIDKGLTNLDDVMQTFYLRLGEIQHKEGSLFRLQYKGRMNNRYAYRILESIIKEAYREKSREVAPLYRFHPQEKAEKWELAYEELMQGVGDCIDDLNEHDLRLLELHFIHGYSMRKLSEMSEIPTHTIFHRLKGIKQIIKTKVKDKYERYIEQKAQTEVIQDIRIGRCGPQDHRDNRN